MEHLSVILFGVLVIITLATLFFRIVSKEDYAFLALEGPNEDIAIVASNGDLNIDNGTLKSSSGFVVDGDVTTSGKVNGVGFKQGRLINVNSITIGNTTLTGERLKLLTEFYPTPDGDRYIKTPTPIPQN